MSASYGSYESFQGDVYVMGPLADEVLYLKLGRSQPPHRDHIAKSPQPGIGLRHVGNHRRKIPLVFPDSIAVKPNSKTLYVTTRKAFYGKGKGPLKLLKFSQVQTQAADHRLRYCSTLARLSIVVHSLCLRD